MTIAKIQKDLKAFDQFARQTIKHEDADPVDALQTKWLSLFKAPMSKESAKSFSQYYRKMVSKHGGKRLTRKMRKTRKLRGGAATILSPASIDYQMVPGANVQMYGHFPVEADTDPSTIRDMDVYFNSGMSRTCGVENSARQVPAGMGSNKVGGRRRRGRTLRRRHAGGSLMESLQVHPYVSTAPPNVFQVAANFTSLFY
jgi:hypothetical protein